MGHRVICISRVTAAGSEAVGHLVAERLGFRYVDDEILTLAAQHAGLDRAVVASAERHRGRVAQMLDAVFTPPAEIEGYLKRRPREYAASGASGTPSSPPTATVRQLIKEAIADVATRGDVVMLAHAASMALAGRADVLRVHVTASVPTRVRRLAAANPLLREDEYAKAIDESDRQRREYLADFYDVRDETFTHYDLVLNTDAIPIDTAVGAIAAIATA